VNEMCHFWQPHAPRHIVCAVKCKTKSRPPLTIVFFVT
jgi:hypothetical protein